MSESMHDLILDYWSHFQETKQKGYVNNKGNQIVPEKSLPIMWHGTLWDYYKSKFKVITVSINPHPRAFGKSTPHFDMDTVDSICNEITINKEIMTQYTEQMDSYFERNCDKTKEDEVFQPYEEILNMLNTSYYKSNDYGNKALHLDMFSPLVTVPTWTKLKKTCPSVSKELEQSGKKLFQRLIEVLKPDMVIVSIEKRSVEKVFGINEQWNKVIYKKETTKKNNINAILYSDSSNPVVLYGQYNLYGKERNTFGYASDDEFNVILKDVRSRMRNCI